MAPFESVGAVSYLHFTMTVSQAVREIFSVKEWRGLAVVQNH